ncbi:MAG: signal peptide peptidase SppA [Gemmataceae bacterium]
MTRLFLVAGLIAALVGVPGAAEPPKKKNPFIDGGSATVEDKDSKGEKKEESKSAKKKVAHIKLSGSLDESPVSEETLFGSPSENLTAKLNRIRKAAKDPEVSALYIELDEIQAGFGKLNELKRAIADFRATGKKAYAYAESLSAKSYLLGLACNEIILPESGELMFVGLRAELRLYKGLLDKVMLKADVLKVGAYKSAVEPFISDHISDANREQITSMLDDNFKHEIVDWMIAARPERKWTADQVASIIDQGPFTSLKAQKLGLIDRIAYVDEFEGAFTKEGKAEISRNYAKAKAEEPDFSNPFAMLAALSPKKKKESKADKIAIIYAVGGIESGKGGSGNPLTGGGNSVGSETIVNAIHQAEKNETVKAIVLRVDSPGGSALASDVMWRAIIQCKKPVVCSMGDVAASGGYYIAMPCKKIYAEPGTITGSIGVFGMKLVTEKLESWAGLKTEVITRGKNTGVNSMTFAWSESERKSMTEYIETIYDQFTSKAVAGRNAAGVKISKEELLKLAGGRVWTGRQAKENGLVDELGTLDDAIAGAKKLAGIDPKKEMEQLILPKPTSFLEKLMEGDASLPFMKVDSTLLAIPGVNQAFRDLAPLLRTNKDTVKAFMPLMVEFK